MTKNREPVRGSRLRSSLGTKSKIRKRIDLSVFTMEGVEWGSNSEAQALEGEDIQEGYVHK